MRTQFIYHKSCYDGFTAAWIYHKYVNSNAIFIPCTYGDPFPSYLETDRVIIADFSFPRAILEKIVLEVKSLFILDHHKTAQEDLKDLSYAVFDMNRSGCGLVWDYFVGGNRILLVDIVEDRDLWKLSIKDTEDVMAIISATPMTFEDWDILSYTKPSTLIDQGRAINRYIKLYGEKAFEHKTFESISRTSYRGVPVVNMLYMNCSEHLNAFLKNHSEYPFVMSFFRRADRRYQFSLRSVGDFDVSDIAKKFGGGGHKNAAGFDVDFLEEVFGIKEER